MGVTRHPGRLLCLRRGGSPSPMPGCQLCGVGYWQYSALEIVTHGSSEVQGHELDLDNTSTSSRSRQLLKPLSELYATAHFTMRGLVNGDYRVKIVNQTAQPTSDATNPQPRLQQGISHSLCCTPFKVSCERYSIMDVIDGKAKKQSN